jgi:L-lactate dehydrogenase (cytochrome)/(S)-mandelate dehydrogenase
MKIDQAITIEDLRKAAKRRLPRILFDFIEGGVEDERGLARNAGIFGQFTLLPRYFVDVSRRTQTTTLFGKTYASPFGICPTGAAGLWRPGADEMLARAAAAANIPFILSIASNASIETTVKLAPGNMWSQLYCARDRSIADRLLPRVRDLGVETLVVTADVPVSANRERSMRNGFRRPLRLTAATVIDGLRHPAWLAGYLRAGGRMPLLQTWAPYVRAGASGDEVAEHFASQFPTADVTWADLERWRRAWPGKLVVKGILHPDDAARAAGLGVDGIIVSNHGGRQLDTAPSPIEALPAIRAAVGPRFTLMLDSGIRRGSDILIALCLGIQFVFVGRATLYGVAAFGLPGAQRAIAILRREIDVNMGQIGCASVAALGPQMIAAPPSMFTPRPTADGIVADERIPLAVAAGIDRPAVLALR